MDRPIRYQHNRFLGDKRRQVVYDLDEISDRAVLDQLFERKKALGAEQKVTL